MVNTMNAWAQDRILYRLRKLVFIKLKNPFKEVKKKLAILEREIPKRLIDGKIDKMLHEKRSNYEPRQKQNQTYSTVDMVITMYELDANTRAAEGTLQDKVCVSSISRVNSVKSGRPWKWRVLKLAYNLSRPSTFSSFTFEEIYFRSSWTTHLSLLWNPWCFWPFTFS